MQNHLRYLSEWLPDVTGIVTEGQRGVASHDGGAEQKSADARDFEDENELAEDLAAPTPSPIDSWTKYARPDGWKYGQAVQSLQGGEYDYDTPTPANPVSVAVSQGPSLRAPQGHQQTGTVGSTAVSTPAPTASLSRHISAQRAPGGAILKFTDLFDTVPQRIAFPKASAARIADGEEAGAAVEDEQDEFAVFSSLNAGPAATDGNASNVGKLPHLSQLQVWESLCRSLVVYVVTVTDLTCCTTGPTQEENSNQFCSPFDYQNRRFYGSHLARYNEHNSCSPRHGRD
jgi:hypothetical protein